MSAPPAAARVLVVASELPPGPGGIGTHAHAIATALHDAGRTVELLGSQHYVTAEERAAFNRTSPVPITTFADAPDPARTAARRYRQLRAAIERFEPDVIVASGGRVLWLAARAGARTATPVVAVTHGSELGGPTWQRALTRRSLGACAAVIAVSEFTAGLVRALDVHREVDVIPNGGDGERFQPDAARRVAFRARHALADRPVVLTVGNVTERKGQRLVVEALPRIVREVPDVAYVVVGRPTEAAALEALATQLGVREHLHILGQLDAEEVVDAQCAADLFAMTSTATATGDVEGFGIAVIEAALCGVPAVVTAGTGAEEAVSGGVTGLVVSSTSESIGSTISLLLRDDPRRQALGAAALRAASTTGTWARRAEQYADVVDRAARGSLPRMLVVSHTPHHRNDRGDIVAFGPTTRELDQLATLTSELVHIAPMYEGEPPGIALPICAENIRHVPVEPAGGPRSIDRLLALRAVPRWAVAINRELRSADVVHVRCPAGIAMVALAVLTVRRTPRARWFKYAGNWAPDERDAVTYRLQRWWLRRGIARGAVTVNGRWPDQPPWVRTFDNPTLTTDEVAAGAAAAAARPNGPPFRAVFVGRVEAEKGAGIAVDVVAELRGRGVDLTLDLIGDGPLRAAIEQRADELDAGAITVHGWLTRAEVEAFLARAHLMLLPTTASEGFPKVVGEALAFGCVPVTSGVSSLRQVLGETGGAVVVEDGRWADAVDELLHGGRLALLSAEGVRAAGRFSYATYLARVRELAQDAWGRSL